MEFCQSGKVGTLLLCLLTITNIKHFKSLHYFIINIVRISLSVDHDVEEFVEVHHSKLKAKKFISYLHKLDKMYLKTTVEFNATCSGRI